MKTNKIGNLVNIITATDYQRKRSTWQLYHLKFFLLVLLIFFHVTKFLTASNLMLLVLSHTIFLETFNQKFLQIVFLRLFFMWMENIKITCFWYYRYFLFLVLLLLILELLSMIFLVFSFFLKSISLLQVNYFKMKL